MWHRLFACLGIFAVMALSNTIVPVLPSYAAGPALQGAIYAAYFLGAFLMTLPAGLMSDRFGRSQVMRAGLAVTIFSGVFLLAIPFPFLVLAARFLEGLGAGLFVAAGMAYVNSLPDHDAMSGYFMAALNGGLVAGLVAGGLLASVTGIMVAGIMAVLLFTPVPVVLGMLVPPALPSPVKIRDPRPVLVLLVTQYRWLWYSSIVLIGITGVVTALYPEFSDAPAGTTGLWIAGMSIATIVSVLLASRFKLEPVLTIKRGATGMAIGTVLCIFSPAGFLVIGALAGVVMIAQMTFLADTNDCQGAAMGLYSTSGYLGMSLLPFLASVIAETTTFFTAFCVTAGAALTVVAMISRSTCRRKDDA